MGVGVGVGVRVGSGVAGRGVAVGRGVTVGRRVTASTGVGEFSCAAGDGSGVMSCPHANNVIPTRMSAYRFISCHYTTTLFQNGKNGGEIEPKIDSHNVAIVSIIW